MQSYIVRWKTISELGIGFLEYVKIFSTREKAENFREELKTAAAKYMFYQESRIIAETVDE